MSVVVENGGSIPDPALYYKCRDDKEWMYHYRNFNKFKYLKDQLDQICFEEYELMSLREEELGVGE